MKQQTYSETTRRMAFPPESDVPQGQPPASACEVAPHPAANFGGIDTEPQEVLTPEQQVADLLDHEGLDQELPG